MIDQMLKIAGVKNEKEFYKKYPTEASFMAKHGQAFEKAMGGKTIQDMGQLQRLDDLVNFTNYNMPEARSGIYIKPSKRGTFTAAAKKKGLGVQEFASKVLANKQKYSSAMVKKANFARNAAGWKKEYGGEIEMEAGGRMPAEYARARFRAAGNEDMLGDYGYARYGAGIEPFTYYAGGGYMMAQPGAAIPRQEDFNSYDEFAAARDAYFNYLNAALDEANAITPINSPVNTMPEADAYMQAEALNVKTPIRVPPSYGGVSVVDMLKELGVASDYESRKELAKKVGLTNYKGTAEQNRRLIELVNEDMRVLKDMPKATKTARASQRGGGQRTAMAANAPVGYNPLANAPAEAATYYPARANMSAYSSSAPTSIFNNPDVNFYQGALPANAEIRFGKAGDPAYVARQKAAYDDAVILEQIRRDPRSTANINKEKRKEFAKDLAIGTFAPWLAEGALMAATTRYLPYGLKALPSGVKAIAEKSTRKLLDAPTSTGWSTQSGLRSAAYPLRKMGGYTMAQAGITAPPDPRTFINESDYVQALEYYNQTNTPANQMGGMNRPDPRDYMSERAYLDDLEAWNQMNNQGMGFTNPPGLQTVDKPRGVTMQSIIDAAPKNLSATPPALTPPAPKKPRNYNSYLLGLSLASSLIPDEPQQSLAVDPSTLPYYNPYPMGTGSQANMYEGGWIGNTNAVEFPYKSGIRFGKGGEMIKRKDGSYSRRGLWDNIRANKGSGKKPTKAMLEQEKKIRAEEMAGGGEVTNLYYPRGGEIMNVADLDNPIARMGGQLRRNYDMGGELEFFDDRGGAQPVSANKYSNSPMIKFVPEDQKHSKGGIKMAYGGTPVEVEGDEYAYVTDQMMGEEEPSTMAQGGNAQKMVVFGNMKNPMTKRKFKKDAEVIANLEQKANKKVQKGLDLVESADPNNPYERLKFNTGVARFMGGEQELMRLSAERDALANLQQSMLDEYEAMGIEPMEGNTLFAQSGITIDPATKDKLKQQIWTAEGKPSYGTKTADPKGSAFGKYQFIKGTRLGYYNRNKDFFKNTYGVSSPQEFENAFLSNKGNIQEGVMDVHLDYLAKKFKNNPQAIAIAHRLGEGAASQLLKTGKATIPTSSGGKRTITWKDPIMASSFKEKETVEDYVKRGGFPFTAPTTPAQPAAPATPAAPPVVTTQPITPTQPYVQKGLTPTYKRPDYVDYVPLAETTPNIVNTPKNLESDADAFNMLNIVPELVAIAKNRRQPVWRQKFTPLLEQPYQISLQDQVNAVTDQYRAGLQSMGYNPAAQMTSAGLAASQITPIIGQEFRFNQGESARVYNQNRGLINQAMMTNLGLAQDQAQKQSLAQSMTDAVDREALSSMVQKKLQDEALKNELRVYENMYKFRYDPQFRARYEGEDPNFKVDKNIPTQGSSVGGSGAVPKKAKMGGNFVREFKKYKY